MTNELAIRILTGDVLGTTEQTQEAIEMAVKALSNTNGETIYRQDAVPRTSVEYICRKNTVSTNPYEHKYHDKFMQFMDDPEISDFGRWQHSNGFNTALVAVKCDLDRVPSTQPERKKGKWIPHSEKCREYIGTVLVNVEYNYWLCDACGYRVEKERPMYNFCPNCGEDMRGEQDE